MMSWPPEAVSTVRLTSVLIGFTLERTTVPTSRADWGEEISGDEWTEFRYRDTDPRSLSD
jgi:hypothetical protein